MGRMKRWNALLCLGILVLTAGTTWASQGPSAAQRAALGALERRAGEAVTLRWDEGRGVAKFISGRLFGGSAAPAEEQAQRLIAEAAPLLGVQDVATELGPAGTRETGVGTFVTFQQFYRGLQVLGGKITVRVSGGGAATVANFFEPGLSLDPVPALSREEAERSAAKLAGGGAAEAVTLLVVPWEGSTRLAYRVDFPLRSEPRPNRLQVYVDARTGAEILVDDRIRHDGPATGSGLGSDGQTKSLDTYRVGTKYYLGNYPVSGVQAVTAKTYSAGGGTRLPGTLLSDSDNYWEDPAAVDAHYYMNYTVDFLAANYTDFSWYGSSGFARSGGFIATVHYDKNYDNAFWDGQQLVFGDGGYIFSPLSGALDVVAHEMTHGITEAINGLVYCKEAGALNESWSDVIGMFVTIDAGDLEPYQIGEEIMKIAKTPGYEGYYALRRMDDPPFRTDAYAYNDYVPADPLSGWGQPGHTSEQYIVGTCLPTNDYGGVHINSGIPNKAAYLITEAIGAAKAQQIYYLAMFYLTSTSGFTAARDAVEQATLDLYPSDLSAVQNAFTQVGIL
ncbi:MAG: peptidase M4 family protein [Deltaproteobacteria bacterium]|nr:peptidase M4 family protein [Deltaproteobacteria bacterium]